MAVVAPEKPVSAKICSAAARMRASLSLRRRWRRLAGETAEPSGSPRAPWPFMTLASPHDKVDHLVRLSLAFAAKRRLASTGNADEQATRSRPCRGWRAGYRAGAPGAGGVSLEFRRYRDAARPGRGAGGFEPLLL